MHSSTHLDGKQFAFICVLITEKYLAKCTTTDDFYNGKIFDRWQLLQTKTTVRCDFACNCMYDSCFFCRRIYCDCLTLGLCDVVNLPNFEIIVSPSKLISPFESSSLILNKHFSLRYDLIYHTFDDRLKSVDENCRLDILTAISVDNRFSKHA